MFFVLGFNTGAAACQIFKTAGLETDDVEILVVVEAVFVAFEVVDGREGGFHV